MNKKIIEHFQNADPILFSYIERIEMFEWNAGKNLFADLCDHIISQQLSEKAGETIWKRFKTIFGTAEISAERLLEIPDQDIRNAGCSWAKIKSLKDLATKVHTKSLNLDTISSLSNEEVIEQLTLVRGIGPWTAEMFLMFSLRREDIFSHGDLGLRNAIQKIYEFKEKPSKQQIEEIVKKWSPYKSYASRILWKTLLLK